MSKDTIIAACAQLKPEFGDTEGNLQKVIRMTQETEADLILFPELVTSGYQFRSREELSDLSLDLNKGSEFTRLKELAGDFNRFIAIGIPEHAADKLFNSIALIEPSGNVHIYRKIHLFYKEKDVFDPGDRPPEVINTTIGRLGMMVCFDWIFPEVARVLAMQGAQILVHTANLVLQYCQRAMFARSIENGMFSMTCNRIGSESRTDEELTFTGSSQILGNRGAMLAQASSDQEQVITTEIRPSDADDKMMTAKNHLLNDRRTDLYKGLI